MRLPATFTPSIHPLDYLKSQKLKLSYPILMDPEGEVGLLYGAWGMPATYLIDEKGMVLARLWGPSDWYSPAARNLIKSLLDKKNRPA